MQAKKSYHHGELRDALLVAAEQQLNEEGPGGLSLRKLGRDLGVTPGAPYRHFEDKDALLIALSTHGFMQLRETMIEMQENAIDPEDRLRRAAIGYLKFARSSPELFRLMFGWMPSREAPELHASGEATFKVLRETIQQAEAAGLLKEPTQDVGFLAWSAVHGAAFLMIDNGLTVCGMRTDPDPETVGNRLHERLWAGIGKSGTR